MHILALVTDAFGGRGGIARYNRDLITALSNSSHVETIAVLPRLTPEGAGPLPNKVQQSKPVFNPAVYAAHAARALATMPKGTVVFCGHLLMSPLGAFLSRAFQKPLWLQVHGIDAWGEPSRIVKKASEQADLITSVSRYTRARMLKWWDADPQTIKVLPNTVGKQFYPRPKSGALRERYGLQNRKVLLTVSRLGCADRYKGIDKVIAALPDLRKRHPDITYLIVGDGDDAPNLKAIARTFGVDDITIFAGHVPEQNLPDHFCLGDVYVMPSMKEGFGIVFIEAAAAGLPVIGGDCDGSADALADGVIGKMINPDDDEALTNALLIALSGSLKAEARHVRRFAFENFAGHVDDLVQTLAR